MRTLSILQAREALREATKEFEGLIGYKVEFGIWDHSEKPYVQFYVSCMIKGKQENKHVKADTLLAALQQIREWYEQVTHTQLVIQTDEILA